jgi:L-fuconolactonase
MRLDAHLHFWKPACGFDNRPIADHAAYRRDFLPEHIADELDASGVDGVILVQSAPQTGETDWCLELARDEPRVLGVTAWVDLDVPHCDFAPLLAQPKVVGIRAQLRRIADADFITRPNVVANLGRALRAGLNVTILAEARHYAPVLSVLDRLPAGPVTLNHLGLPFPDVDRSAWRAAMRAFERRPSLYVQLSGLPFLHGERWREADAQSILADALEIFGPQRLLFASDWPMLLRFATYRDWVEAVEAFVDRERLGSDERAAIFAGNAQRANPRLAFPDSSSFAAERRTHGARA